MWKKYFKNLLLGVTAVLFAVFICEVLLVLLNFPAAKVSVKHMATWDSGFITPTKAYVRALKPGSQLTVIYPSNHRNYFGAKNELKTVLNNNGFRGKDFKQEKAAGLFRVAYLGDSFVFGYGVKDHHTIPYYLQQKLEQSSRKKIEIMNFGQPALNLENYFTVFINQAIKFKPDLVFVGFTLNDFEKPTFVMNQNNELKVQMSFEDDGISVFEAKKLRKKWFYQWRVFRVFLNFYTRYTSVDKTLKYYNELFDHNNEYFQINVTALRYLSDVCHNENIRCVLTIFPLFYKLDGAYPFEKYHEKIKIIASNLNLETIDFLELFKGQKANQYWAHPHDYHPNEIANKMMAEHLEKFLLSKKYD